MKYNLLLILIILTPSAFAGFWDDAKDIVLVNPIKEFIDKVSQDLTNFIGEFALTTPNIGVVESIWNICLYLVGFLTVLMLVYIGLRYAKTDDPSVKVMLNSQLFNIIIIYALILLMPLVISHIIEFVNELALYLFSGNISGESIATPAFGIGMIYWGISIMLMILLMFLNAIRLFLLFFLLSVMPLTIALFVFEPTRQFGRKIVNLTLVNLFMPAVWGLIFSFGNAMDSLMASYLGINKMFLTVAVIVAIFSYFKLMKIDPTALVVGTIGSVVSGGAAGVAAFIGAKTAGLASAASRLTPTAGGVILNNNNWDKMKNAPTQDKEIKKPRKPSSKTPVEKAERTVSAGALFDSTINADYIKKTNSIDRQYRLKGEKFRINGITETNASVMDLCHPNRKGFNKMNAFYQKLDMKGGSDAFVQCLIEKGEGKDKMMGIAMMESRDEKSNFLERRKAKNKLKNIKTKFTKEDFERQQKLFDKFDIKIKEK